MSSPPAPTSPISYHTLEALSMSMEEKIAQVTQQINSLTKIIEGAKPHGKK